MTVYRIKNRIEDISSQVKEIGETEFGTQIISKIKLKKSVLSPKGPEYSDSVSYTHLTLPTIYSV